MSDQSDVIEDPYLGTPSVKSGSAGLHGFFKALRNRSNNVKFSDSREAGMEQNLINKIEKMNFKEQMEAFYTAYSKVWPRPGEMISPRRMA